MDVVLTAYFNGRPDPQREGIYWRGDPRELDPLVESVDKLIMFTDCMEKQGVKIVKWPCTGNPYFERWYAYLDYLKTHRSISKVFCVDATDVVMLNNPFEEMVAGRIYVGDERQSLNCDWMLDNQTELFMRDFFKPRTSRVLNVGLLGGRRTDIIKLLEDVVAYDQAYDLGKTDMGIFNYLLYSKYQGRVTHGEPVNTVFKAYETESTCWWAHK